MSSEWVVYVIQGTSPDGKKPYYVGCTTDVARRIRQHNGEIAGGARSTSRSHSWELRVLHGPYFGRSEAQRVEYALKHSRRGARRLTWTPEDHPLCRVATSSMYPPLVGESTCAPASGEPHV